MKRKRILLADDHKFITEGLKSLLDPDYDVVGIVSDGKALVEEAARLQPDIIVADISMPRLNGIEAIRQVVEQNSQARIIVLTMHPDITYATRALEAGAAGYVLKHSAPQELIQAIEVSLVGKKFITERIKSELDATPHTRQDPVRKLTRRQREVLQLLAEGNSAKQVGDILNISARTVEFHKYNIMEELGIHNSAELVQYAIKLGIVSI
jgi:DNA-binding NarL/FixJ family response regulator